MAHHKEWKILNKILRKFQSSIVVERAALIANGIQTPIVIMDDLAVSLNINIDDLRYHIDGIERDKFIEKKNYGTMIYLQLIRMVHLN